MFVENGLPYMLWCDFLTVRNRLSHAYRMQKRAAAMKAEVHNSEIHSITKAELFKREVEQTQGPPGDIEAGELYAERILSKKRITYDDVLEAIERAHIKPLTKRRSCVEGVDDAIHSWAFGAFSHGPHTGVTNRTTQRPMLVTLVNQFLRQEAPGVT